MKASDKIIEFKNIQKGFGDKVVLDDISFYVNKGEFLTLLGPSGCGKTTLLRLLAGFGNTDSGEILINGENITNVPPHERPVNTVFQRYALFQVCRLREESCPSLQYALLQPRSGSEVR